MGWKAWRPILSWGVFAQDGWLQGHIVFVNFEDLISGPQPGDQLARCLHHTTAIWHAKLGFSKPVPARYGTCHPTTHANDKVYDMRLNMQVAIKYVSPRADCRLQCHSKACIQIMLRPSSHSSLWQVHSPLLTRISILSFLQYATMSLLM